MANSNYTFKEFLLDFLDEAQYSNVPVILVSWLQARNDYRDGLSGDESFRIQHHQLMSELY